MDYEASPSATQLVDLFNVDVKTAGRILKKYNGDIERATNHILDGNLSDGSNDSIPALVSPGPDNVIDLTKGDTERDGDYELNQAMKDSVSMQNSANWAVVPSNVAQDSVNDQQLNQALENSLHDLQRQEQEETIPDKDLKRDKEKPIVLWPEQPGYAYSALVIHALFHVPQIRRAISKMRLPLYSEPRSSPVNSLYNLQEIFTNMDLAALSIIVDNDTYLSFPAEPLDRNENATEKAAKFLANIATEIESGISQDADPTKRQRLLFFRHCTAIRRQGAPVVTQNKQDRSLVVSLERKPLSEYPLDPNNPINYFNGDSLIYGLSTTLNNFGDDQSTHDVIMDPSEVFVFRIDEPAVTGALEPFMYPKYLYLDQFLLKNLELANKVRSRQGGLIANEKHFQKRRFELSSHNNISTLSSLRACAHYFETLASSRSENEERKQLVGSTLTKIHKSIAHLESSLEDMENQLKRLHEEINHVFDITELQQHKYILRAALLHTGSFGRSQLYSYVHDSNGKWWKTQNHEVKEVTEATVFNDTSGSALRAGPFLLIYSRAVPDEELLQPTRWPDELVNRVEQNNQEFLSTYENTVPQRRKLPVPTSSTGLTPDVTMLNI